MTRLEVDVRRKAYSEAPVLRDVRFTLPAGQFAALAGPSGCGKTTLLNIIAGLDRGADADIRIDGLPPAEAPPPGMAFQSARLMPWLTAAENLALVAPRRDRGAREDARNLLSMVGLGTQADSWPNRLSGGMRRRVAFARALVNRPGLLLLDEPFQSLDTVSAARMREHLLRYWQDRRATVLMITHDLGEALALAERVLVMSASPGTLVDDIALGGVRPRDESSARRLSRRIAAGFDAAPPERDDDRGVA